MKIFKIELGADIAMVVTIVAILSLIILPVPTLLIDSLLAVNITISVLMLMVTIYIPSAISLSTFPSLLLFTTLFRLGLNIASTKLILLHADAGHIIEAFGNLVVGGNIAVGVIVFLIIALVQFIVITKGSERVAEVGARFTLDAMPGKQMSIDADLRAGYLTGPEARRKRGHLAMESQLHGGMDGAMKFVKGDAIAALLITAINIFGGIVVGVLFHNMTAGEAANRFVILSIGDAMVSQIPSLLISVAAGLLITRVADEQAKPRNLGDEITSQLAAKPRALYMAAALLGGFALVPGFPWYAFLGIAAGLVMLARTLTRREANKTGGGELASLQREGATGDAPTIEEKSAAFSCPLAVTLPPLLGDTLDKAMLNAAFERERARLQEQLGLPFPGIKFWTVPTQKSDTYEVLVHDVPSGRGALPAGKRWVLQAPEEAAQSCEPGPGSCGEKKSRWVDAATDAAALGIEALHHEQIVARHAAALLRDHAHLFLGIQEMSWIFERLTQDYPQLVSETQKVLPMQRISEVLRRLLEEQLSIRNMRTIMEALIMWGPKEKDVVMLTEYVRGELGRYLSHRASGGGSTVSAVLLEPALEKMIRESIKATPAGNYLALPPDQTSAIAQRVAALAGDAPRSAFAVVTSMDIRRYVRRIVEPRLRWLDVYSYQELGSLVQIKPIGRVSL
jgi:type III secretion protein V